MKMHTKTNLSTRMLRIIGIAALVFGSISTTATAVTKDEIIKRGVFNVAMEAAFAPFEMVEGGKPVGYDPDILALIAKEWGVEVNIQDIRFQGLLVGLEQRKFDMVGSALLMNEARASKFAFTAPIAAGRVVMYKKVGNPKEMSVDDLSGLKVSVCLPPCGDENIFRSYHEKLKSDGKSADDIIYIQATADRVLALLNDQFDLAVGVSTELGITQKKFPGQLELVGEIGDSYYIGWVVHPEDVELRDEVSKTLRKLRDTGKLNELQKKWFNTTFELPDSGYLPKGAI